MTREQDRWAHIGRYTYRQRQEYAWIVVRTKAQHGIAAATVAPEAVKDAMRRAPSATPGTP